MHYIISKILLIIYEQFDFEEKNKINVKCKSKCSMSLNKWFNRKTEGTYIKREKIVNYIITSGL